jgi:hypothetical protein
MADVIARPIQLSLAPAALLVFLAGTGVLLLGLFLTAVEVGAPHRAARYEMRRVLGLGTAT